MSKKFFILFGGLLIMLMLLASNNVIYAAGGTPTPTRTRTSTPARTATPTHTPTPAPTPIGVDLGLSATTCRDTTGNPAWGLDELYVEGKVEWRCQGNDQWFSPFTGQSKTWTPPPPLNPRTSDPGMGPWIFLVVLIAAFVWGTYRSKPKPKVEREEQPHEVKLKVKLQLLSNTQVVGLLIAVVILWSAVSSINSVFISAREAGLAWKEWIIATGQTMAQATPSLARDGLLVVLWVLLLEPTIKLIPVFGEAFGFMMTMTGAGAGLFLGRFYGAIWKATKWVFKNVLKPIGRFIWGFFGLLVAMIASFPKRKP